MKLYNKLLLSYINL